MTDEQQLMWDMLSADPAGLCHVWARDILKSKRSMHRKADKYLGLALDLFTVEDTSSIVKTWLGHYNMPLNPSKLENFDKFHRRCGRYVISSCSFSSRDTIKDFA
jgi:hypothetical protein